MFPPLQHLLAFTRRNYRGDFYKVYSVDQAVTVYGDRTALSPDILRAGVPEKEARYSTGRDLTKSLPVESPDTLRDRNKNKKNLEDADKRKKKT
ncbi:hypothetical protein BS47DRAFT_1354903 [Hydnum rufescens UP504]|uniref:Uncharacterized protein n=1 Tax=Hydnum rufescens UP504 TaxID=1448309 RepID=A0A9P6DJK3_9AGAM|nr:hypothetical protein BS47DRAFT_1354903 [Hydnum rufescens UP504]